MWTELWPLLRKFLRLNFLVLSAKLLAAEQPEAHSSVCRRVSSPFLYNQR